MNPKKFLQQLDEYDVGVFTGVPCSMLNSLIANIPSFVVATDEAEAMGIALGSSLAGKIGVVLMQNSGLGNVVDILTSFANPYRIPCLMVISLRGFPDDAAHHRQMGELTIPILNELSVPYFYSLPDIHSAFVSMRVNSKPVAFIVKDPFDAIVQ